MRACVCSLFARELVVHSGELALRATGNLLSAELDELGLQLLQLSLELILVLAPELGSLDLGGRLRIGISVSISTCIGPMG
jgi:hypothetical protein